jgi:hypothetical protein
MDNKETEHSLTILKSDCYEFEELVPLATQRDNHECIHDVLNDSFKEYVATGDIYHCNQDIGDLQVDNHSIDSFDIVSNSSTNLLCHEDEIVPFENPKGDYQIDTLAGDNLRSTTDSKGSRPLSDLQFKRNSSDYEEQYFQKTSNLQERQQEDYISPYVSYMSMSDEKDEYDELKDDIFSNLFQDPIVDDSMLESSSLSLEIVLDVPIFDKYGDKEEDFKSWEGLLTTKISSSPTFSQRDDQRCCHKDQIASFENSEYVELTDISVEDSFKPAIDGKDNFQFFDCSTHEEEDDEDNLEFPDLQRLSNLQLEHQENCSIYEKEDDEHKSSGQKLSLYFSPTEIKQSTFSIEFCEGKEEHHYSQLDQQLEEVFHCDFNDPFANYLESLNNICVKLFLSLGNWLDHLFKPLCCWLSLPLLFRSRSSMMSVNQFLTGLHWKHEFT